MTTLVLEKTNRVYLTDAAITTNVNTVVTLSVFDDAGEFVKDSGGADLSEKNASWDATAGKFYVDLTFKSDTQPGYVRLLWGATVSAIAVELNAANTPADYELISTGISSAPEAQIVPVTFWLENYLAKDLRADVDFKNVVAAWSTNNRRDVERFLQAAQGELESRTKLVFFRRQETIQRDYTAQDFRSEWWILQLDNRPVISVESYKLQYGVNPPMEISGELADSLVVNKKMGHIEFVPTTVQGNLFTAVITNISALGISLLDSGFSRIPALFHVTYTYGLDFPTLSAVEKASIRHAVCRNALMKALPQVDPLLRATSLSRSIDGVSKSKSSGMGQLIKTWQEEEKLWTDEMMRKYAVGMDMAVI